MLVNTLSLQLKKLVVCRRLFYIFISIMEQPMEHFKTMTYKMFLELILQGLHCCMKFCLKNFGGGIMKKWN